jgi:hypothetical protein
MSNVIIKGESIKNKKDAEKYFKDHDADITSDGWQEREAKCEAIDRKCDAKCYDVLKHNSYGKYYGFHWQEGQWERIFGKGEGREKEHDE